MESDAKRIMDILPKRFNRFGLALHPEKTKVIAFKRPSSRQKGKGKGTFDFLGFTFYWTRSRREYWVIKKKTARKRMNRFMKGVWQWCKTYRHDPMKEQYETLSSKLLGFYQYYGVRSNYKALEAVFEYTEQAWRQWLSRRSHKGKVQAEDLRRTYPLPQPKIVHNI